MIVVGDLHGKIKILEDIIKEFEGEKFCFVGDYLDAFDEPPENQVRVLEVVLDMVEGGKAIGYMGNHELSYLNPNANMASGWNTTTSELMQPFKGRMIMSFNDNTPDPTNLNEGFFISHAGVSKTWLENPFTSLTDVGYARGGYKKCGGPYWCDWRDEFVPVEGWKQVCGHTRRNSIQNKGDNYCIDVLDRKRNVLEIVDGKAIIRKF